MRKLPGWFRALVRAVGTVSPPMMAAIAWRLFWSLGKPMAVSPASRNLHARAVRETVDVNGREAVIYRWGTGAEVVLLVHGWRGRATQFAVLIAALESPSRTVVAFDAPGNGDAVGKRTDVFDYIALITRIAKASDGIDALIAHSFGALAVFAAIRQGVRARRVVSIAGVSNFDYVVETFSAALGLSQRVVQRLRRRIERQIFDGDTSFWRTYVSELKPTDKTPLLVVHDRDDWAVDVTQGESIARAQVGPLAELYTSGLGHTRILSDPRVVETVVSFADAAARTR